MKCAPVFIMPAFIPQSGDYLYFLQESVKGLLAQTDPDWRLVIIDDGSPLSGKLDYYLRALAHEEPHRVQIIRERINRGAGHCRNVGIRWAADQHAPFVLFNDADDISNERRLEVTRQWFMDEAVSVVYSTFRVIDESSREVQKDRLTASIAEILEAHCSAPVEGHHSWIRMGIESGYINLTSTTAVRTKVAMRCPFPEERVSEDMHTWFRYGAAGGRFVFAPDIPTDYRIPQYATGSSVRQRIGSCYYAEKARVDTDGFKVALSMALEDGTISIPKAAEILQRFFNRLAETMSKEGQNELAQRLKKRSEALVRAAGRSNLNGFLSKGELLGF